MPPQVFKKRFAAEIPVRPAAHNNLGVIYTINGDWLKAKKEFEMALQMSGGKLGEALRNLNICRAEFQPRLASPSSNS